MSFLYTNYTYEYTYIIYYSCSGVLTCFQLINYTNFRYNAPLRLDLVHPFKLTIDGQLAIETFGVLSTTLSIPAIFCGFSLFARGPGTLQPRKVRDYCILVQYFLYTFLISYQTVQSFQGIDSHLDNMLIRLNIKLT